MRSSFDKYERLCGIQVLISYKTSNVQGLLGPKYHSHSRSAGKTGQLCSVGGTGPFWVNMIKYFETFVYLKAF